VSGAGSPDALDYVGMGLGALNALGIHTGIATVRGASTAMTLGVANPFVSLIEDVLAIFAAIFAILMPIVGAGIAIAVTLAVVWLVRSVYLAARHSNAVPGSVVATR
jgi:Domain of unknown function (DUF4126)